jgi:hypothetical protein
MPLWVPLGTITTILLCGESQKEDYMGVFSGARALRASVGGVDEAEIPHGDVLHSCSSCAPAVAANSKRALASWIVLQLRVASSFQQTLDGLEAPRVSRLGGCQARLEGLLGHRDGGRGRHEALLFFEFLVSSLRVYIVLLSLKAVID